MPRRMASELIGRRRELTWLAGAAEAAAAGRGGLVLVAGEAGAGKTALARAALAASGFRALEAAALDTPGRPYAPVGLELGPVVAAGRVGVELQHPAGGVHGPGDGARRPLLRLPDVHQERAAVAQLGGDLLGGQVLDAALRVRDQLCRRLLRLGSHMRASLS